MPLSVLNGTATDKLTRRLLACCDVPAWAEAVAAGRPYTDENTLIAVADAAARRLDRADVTRALVAHPRIGELVEGRGTGAGWSRQEQSAVRLEDRTRQALAEANQAYEERFGRVFLICADGRTAEQVLTALRERLQHPAEVEDAVVADELRQIALLRLRRLLEGGAG